MAKYRNGVRIIGGRWKGRKIPVSDVHGLRPTSDRIRETLFNWLQSRLNGAVCLDLFAGSGALSFEALSRGADKVVAVDSHSEAIAHLNGVRHNLGADALQLVHDQAQKLLATPPQSTFDIVFVDPPFEHSLHNVICELLHTNGWLSPAALVYIEAGRSSMINHPETWSLVNAKLAGNVQYMLLQADD